MLNTAPLILILLLFIYIFIIYLYTVEYRTDFKVINKGGKNMSKISYSQSYRDDKFEYRHDVLPSDTKVDVLLTETQLRSMGICRSIGWEHHGTNSEEQNVLVFRKKCSQAATATVDL